MPTIVANADGSYTITVPAPVVPAVTEPTEAAVQAAVDVAVETEFGSSPSAQTTPPVV